MKLWSQSAHAEMARRRGVEGDAIVCPVRERKAQREDVLQMIQSNVLLQIWEHRRRGFNRKNPPSRADLTRSTHREDADICASIHEHAACRKTTQDEVLCFGLVLAIHEQVKSHWLRQVRNDEPCSGQRFNGYIFARSDFVEQRSSEPGLSGQTRGQSSKRADSQPWPARRVHARHRRHAHETSHLDRRDVS